MSQVSFIPFLLKPEHFTGPLSLTADGFHARMTIGPEDRNVAEYYGFPGCEAPEELLEVARQRGSTHIELNPRALPPMRLLEIMQTYQTEADELRDDDGEAVNIPLAFDCEGIGFDWTAPKPGSPEARDEVSQGQRCTLVAFDKGIPVGLVVATFTLYQEAEQPDAVLPTVNILLVYVAPAYRGRGFGLDLSLAMSLIAESFFLDTWNAVPDGTLLRPSVSADLVSEGGESFVLQVFGALQAARDNAYAFPEDYSPEIECEQVLGDFGW